MSIAFQCEARIFCPEQLSLLSWDGIEHREFLLASHPVPGRLDYAETLEITDFPGRGRFFSRVVERNVEQLAVTIHAPNLLRSPAWNPFDPGDWGSRPLDRDPWGNIGRFALGREFHFRQIEPVLEFRNRLNERRHGPQPDHERAMVEMADEYLAESVYVSVHRKLDERVVGSLRCVRAPFAVRRGKVVADGETLKQFFGPVPRFRRPGEKPGRRGLPLPPSRLPMFQYLPIEPAREGAPPTKNGWHFSEVDREGMDIEVGFLAIEDDPEVITPAERQEVWVELWLQMMKIIHRPRDDRISLAGQRIFLGSTRPRLYKFMGFRDMPEFWRRDPRFGGWAESRTWFGAPQPPGPFPRDGEDWWALEADAGELRAFHDALLAGHVARFREFDVLDRALQMMQGPNWSYLLPPFRVRSR